MLDEAGLGFERLLEVNPELVHVRVTPFGLDGPYANLPAADLTIAALGTIALAYYRDIPTEEAVE